MIIHGMWGAIRGIIGFDGRGKVALWRDLRFRGDNDEDLLHLFLLSCIFYTFLTFGIIILKMV